MSLVEEWARKETKEDTNKTFGVSLKKENYKLPFLKLKIANTEIELPQNAQLYYILTRMNVLPLEVSIYDVLRGEIAFELKPDCKISDLHNPEFVEKINKEIDKQFVEKGPYYMIGKAMERCYDYEMDPWLKNEELEFVWKLREEDDGEDE